MEGLHDCSSGFSVYSQCIHFVSTITFRRIQLIHENSGYIVDGLGEDGWRWGYGMFAVGVFGDTRQNTFC